MTIVTDLHVRPVAGSVNGHSVAADVLVDEFATWMGIGLAHHLDKALLGNAVERAHSRRAIVVQDEIFSKTVFDGQGLFQVDWICNHWTFT